LASLERRKCGRAPALYMQSEEAAKRSRPLRNTLRSRRCAQTRYDSGTCMKEWERRLLSHGAGRKQQKSTEVILILILRAKWLMLVEVA
jgi:hypothetical protein